MEHRNEVTGLENAEDEVTGLDKVTGSVRTKRIR